MIASRSLQSGARVTDVAELCPVAELGEAEDAIDDSDAVLDA